MIAIPQCLDFADARLTKDICEFYLRMLEIKNREIICTASRLPIILPALPLSSVCLPAKFRR